MSQIIRRATDDALYAYEDQISAGYIGYKNGIRIGIAGDCKWNGEKVVVREVYALCVRIPQEIIGCASRLAESDFENTIIVSEPGAGKTTLLRDYIRLLSMRYDVLAIDERYELFGEGITMRTGPCCDVIQGVPKEKVYEMSIRTMSPQIVACDELFGAKDLSAVRKLVSSGIKVLATIHGKKLDECYKRIFQRKVYLSDDPQIGTIDRVEGM
ncbi:MAG: hypothetical protein IJ735_00225 [Clostridia bacterium]|nr:hypothetical protein [Clostridia bacterium]